MSMIPDSEKLVISLLQKQGITSFLSFAKPVDCSIDTTIYGYIKDNRFVFCDISLNEYDVEQIYGKKCEYYVIVNNIDSFTFVNGNVASGIETLLINDEQVIISNTNDGFTCSHSSFSFMREAKPIARTNQFAIISFGSFKKIYTCNNDSYINRESQSKDYILPNSPTPVLCKGKLIDDVFYLFSTKDYHVFFQKNVDTKETSLLVYDENGYQLSPKGMPKYVWASNDNMCLIYVDLRKEEDSSYNRKFLGCFAFSEFSEVEFNREFARRDNLNFTILANKDFLILLDDSREYGVDYAVISINGKILSNKGYPGFFSGFRNNVLFFSSETYKTAIDVCGNELCSAKGVLDREIFSRTLNGPRYFADQAIQEISLTDVISPKLYGVFEPRTGDVLIPPIYDEIFDYHTCELGNHGEDNKYYTIDIVSSSNIIAGNKLTYKGAYINNRLCLPVFYEDIEIPTFPIHKDNGQLRNVESNYIFARKDDDWTLYFADGQQISSLSFDELRLLTASSLGYCDQSSFYYVLGKIGNITYIIYKREVTTSLENIYDVVLTPIGNSWDKDYRWAKAISSEGEAIMCEGKLVTNFYNKINVFHTSEALNSECHLFIVENSENMLGVHDDKDKEILPNLYKEITIYPSCLKLDNCFTDINGKVLFEISNEHRLISEKKTHAKECCFVFSSPKGITIVEIYNHETFVNSYNHDDYPEEFVFFDWSFDFESLEFERLPEEDNQRYDDYPDDTDYERDTFYALGGDDYDEWKNNGGNIDDMMDGMGY